MTLIVFPLTFGILLGAALYYRHRPELHKRLMLLAVLGGLTAVPLAHLLGYWQPVPEPWAPVVFRVSLAAFLSLSAVYDRAANGRIHSVSLWVPIVVFVSHQVFFIAIGPSAAWNAFAAWLIR